VARFSVRAEPGRSSSTRTLRVETRLVTESTGLAPAGNSATTTVRPSTAFSVTSFAVPCAASNVLLRVLWYGVATVSAAGAQMRVGPDGFNTSTRVITSNVRQSSAGATWASRRDTGKSARLADVVVAVRKKSRRCMTPNFLGSSR
jgi:hypothetical protein